VARKSRLIVGIFALLALALGACNEVLGIEQATLDETGGRSGNGSAGSGSMQPAPPRSCPSEASSSCSTCVQSACPITTVNACLTNASCRKTLDAYNTQLGATCNGRQGVAYEETLLQPNSPVDPCFGSCKNSCSDSPVLSTCEIYCGCMGSNCGKKFASQADCVNKCIALGRPDLASCRWSHCELVAMFPSENHCDHAVGIGTCADNATLAHPKDCTKSYLGFACVKDADCCSGHCDSQKRSCVEK